jgi:hypothetical protein
MMGGYAAPCHSWPPERGQVHAVQRAGGQAAGPGARRRRASRATGVRPRPTSLGRVHRHRHRRHGGRARRDGDGGDARGDPVRAGGGGRSAVPDRRAGGRDGGGPGPGDAFAQAKKPVLLGAAKAENPRAVAAHLAEAHALGLGEPIALSAAHSLGLDALHAALLPYLRRPSPPWERCQRRTPRLWGI